MKRKFYSNLLNWKDNYSNMPFMLVGARQVGKTYIIQKFCEENYDNYVYINLEKEEKIRNIFENTIDPKEIIEQLEFLLNKKIDVNNSIIFFDEIQVSERAICSLKYFCEDNHFYHVICAGSLLGVALNRFKLSFPVGKVYIEYLYPMDFEEFLMAIDKNNLNEKIGEAFNKNKKLDNVYHEEAKRLLYEFLVVGGMPNSIIEYINKNYKINDVNENIKNNIITSYIADMSKYTTSSECIKINDIYNSIPKQLGKENRKFNYSLIKDGARSDRYKSSINWLIDSHLVFRCKLVERPEIPLKSYENDNIFKIYLNDTGLLCSMNNVNNPLFFEENLMYKGMLLENYVAINLIRNGFNLYFWESKATAEVDFLIEVDNGIIPIEVKAGDNTKSKSLGVYKSKYKPRECYRISGKNFGMDGDVRSIPLYAVHLLKRK